MNLYFVDSNFVKLKWLEKEKIKTNVMLDKEKHNDATDIFQVVFKASTKHR